MLKIALVEDSKLDMQNVVNFIDKFSEIKGERIIVNKFYNAVDFFEENSSFDIVYFDIEMPHMNGMEAAQKLRKKDKDVVIIFITNLAGYALEGYAVEAFDFVIKPVEYYNFSLKLQRAIDRVTLNKFIKINIKTEKGNIIVSSREVFYIEIFDHYLLFHTTSGIFKSLGKLYEIEKTLLEEGFFRSNRCYLINLEYVRGVLDTGVEIQNETLPISRRRRKDLLNAIADYIGKRGSF